MRSSVSARLQKTKREKGRTDRHLCTLHFLVRLNHPDALDALPNLPPADPLHALTPLTLVRALVQLDAQERQRANDVLPQAGRALANSAREDEMRGRAFASGVQREELEEVKRDELEEPVKVDWEQGKGSPSDSGS